jgi:hypothetical protein
MRRIDFISRIALVITGISARFGFASEEKKPAQTALPSVGTSFEAAPRTAELDAFWRDVERAVKEGDFDRYKASCHEVGVLVRGASKETYPLSRALARWKQGFIDTKIGKMKADLEIRFSQRISGETSALETGIFRYSTEMLDRKNTEEFVHFEVLLVKSDRWRTLMEYQKIPASFAEWNQLKAETQ